MIVMAADWTLRRVSHDLPEPVELIGDDGLTLAVVYYAHDAARILAAVNAHGVMLRELRTLERILRPHEERGVLPYGLATLNGIRAAIAKADGR